MNFIGNNQSGKTLQFGVKDNRKQKQGDHLLENEEIKLISGKGKEKADKRELESREL